jgi:hypothetical protein
MAKPLFHTSPKDMEVQHIPKKMEPTPMKEQATEKWEERRESTLVQRL